MRRYGEIRCGAFMEARSGTPVSRYGEARCEAFTVVGSGKSEVLRQEREGRIMAK